MRVLVTGGTGYVGCHTVAALAGQGHQVRLLVRARERIVPALDPLGVTGVRRPGIDSVTGWHQPRRSRHSLPSRATSSSPGSAVTAART
ncbi:MAG TPA: NAD-dependent epimerase/dehydratase family protein [Streptosporangiaceae bacterium]|nr:NAD-dependent epimerase/dehydratase family protein [Streptosporangiaceae bacterium]